MTWGKKSERLNLKSLDKHESVWRTTTLMNLGVFLDLAWSLFRWMEPAWVKIQHGPVFYFLRSFWARRKQQQPWITEKIIEESNNFWISYNFPRNWSTKESAVSKLISGNLVSSAAKLFKKECQNYFDSPFNLDGNQTFMLPGEKKIGRKMEF